MNQLCLVNHQQLVASLRFRYRMLGVEASYQFRSTVPKVANPIRPSLPKASTEGCLYIRGLRMIRIAPVIPIIPIEKSSRQSELQKQTDSVNQRPTGIASEASSISTLCGLFEFELAFERYVPIMSLLFFRSQPRILDPKLECFRCNNLLLIDHRCASELESTAASRDI